MCFGGLVSRKMHLILWDKKCLKFWEELLHWSLWNFQVSFTERTFYLGPRCQQLDSSSLPIPTSSPHLFADINLQKEKWYPWRESIYSLDSLNILIIRAGSNWEHGGGINREWQNQLVTPCLMSQSHAKDILCRDVHVWILTWPSSGRRMVSILRKQQQDWAGVASGEGQREIPLW